MHDREGSHRTGLQEYRFRRVSNRGVAQGRNEDESGLRYSSRAARHVVEQFGSLTFQSAVCPGTAERTVQVDHELSWEFPREFADVLTEHICSDSFGTDSLRGIAP